MNEDVRITLLQELLAGLIERGDLAPLPETAGDGVPLRLIVRPEAASQVAAAPTVRSRRSRGAR